MYGISNRCVQLYPHAVNGMIDHNVCDGSGTGVIVDATSQNNVITRNIICNTVVQGALAEGSVLSTGGNVASDNVMWGNSIDLYQIRNSLFTVTGTAVFRSDVRRCGQSRLSALAVELSSWIRAGCHPAVGSD